MMREFSNDKQPSEIYHEAGVDWADKEAAAQILEDTKSAVVAQWQLECGDIPVNRAEQTVKSQTRYISLIEQIVEARRQANIAKVVMESRKMEFAQWQNKEANARQEMRMTS